MPLVASFGATSWQNSHHAAEKLRGVGRYSFFILGVAVVVVVGVGHVAFYQNLLGISVSTFKARLSNTYGLNVMARNAMGWCRLGLKWVSNGRLIFL